DEVGRLPRGERERVGAVGRADRRVAFEAQVVLETAHDLGLVVDDQDDGHDQRAGRKIVNRLPPPDRLSTVTRPPCASATWRTSASPTPLPRRPCVSLRPTR